MSNKETSAPTFLDEHALGGRNGMTLRDYFAAKAMASYILDDAMRKNSDTQSFWLEAISEASYRMADEMMKARKA